MRQQMSEIIQVFQTGSKIDPLDALQIWIVHRYVLDNDRIDDMFLGIHRYVILITGDDHKIGACMLRFHDLWMIMTGEPFDDGLGILFIFGCVFDEERYRRGGFSFETIAFAAPWNGSAGLAPGSHSRGR